MPISPERFLHCISDGWIAVRDEKANLLGCLPGSPPQEDFVNTPFGSVEVRVAASHVLVILDQQLVHLPKWPGFIPLRASEAEAALPIAQSEGEAEDDQSDIGEPI